MNALYIHIPFCNNICHYCDFVKMVAKQDSKTKYVDSLINELEQYRKYYNDIKTIYIGGGTPTSLPYNDLKLLLEKVKSLVNLNNVIEYSIESNVETLTEDKVKLLKEYGINRVSIGVQTFNNDLLKLIGRVHQKEEIINVINRLKSNGLNNINLDMMFAIPTQTFEMLKEDLEVIKSMDIEHVSYYSLILEENTVFSHWLNKGQIELVDNELEAKMFLHVIEELKHMGYNHYEISNFTKGIISHHNKTYWLNNEYVGCGLGSHGYIDGVRYANTLDLKEYNSRNYIEESNTLTKDDKMTEEMMLGLRLMEGVSIDTFKHKYNLDPRDVYPFINDEIKKGNLEIVNNYIRLTNEALLIGNEIFELFLGD